MEAKEGVAANGERETRMNPFADCCFGKFRLGSKAPMQDRKHQVLRKKEEGNGRKIELGALRFFLL